ncbi:MAG: proteasome subunit beta [Candidatus Pacearchaeota archaeon]
MDEDLKKNVLKTGTSIVGIVCKDGIVMAADKQVSAGQSLVMSKNEQKVFPVNKYLVVAGCGVAGDIQRVPKFLAAELKLKELKSKSRPTVRQAASLLNNINYNGIRQPSTIPQQAGFLIGGFNEDGSTELFSIEPAGSLIKVEDFDANFGSGMPFILGYLERNWKKNLTIDEGVKLAIESIKSSTQRDMGSGYGIDVIVITKDGIDHRVKQKIESNYIEQ